MHPLQSSKLNLDQELETLNHQKQEQDEINENTKRKLKRKIFEYEKKIEKLEFEKHEVENQLQYLSELFEEQKSTISDIELKKKNCSTCPLIKSQRRKNTHAKRLNDTDESDTKADNKIKCKHTELQIIITGEK